MKNKRSVPISHERKTPPGCTPFLLPKPIEEVPKDWRGIDGLIQELYSPDEGPEQSLPEALGLFFAAVKGNQAVIKVLLDRAGMLIAILRAIAKNNPDILRPVARRLLVWPDLIGVKAGYRQNNEWLLKHLEVGKECSIRGKWNPNAPATQTALGMWIWLQTNQSALELPRLTQTTRKQWFKAGWTALLDVTYHHPEKHAYLRQIGLHYGKHSEKTGAQKRVTPATRESNIREGIRKQVWQSFQNVTRHLPKSAD
jgi:hypothetical protein